jgi:precorrin-3B synthase
MSAMAQLRTSPTHRRGWCPGALRPMETGDGLLARVRARRGRLSLDQADVLAEAALRCGNGAIGLSARANLHLRGLSQETLPDLHARLEAAGLIDADPEVERLRNVVSSPLDDIDPEALFDLGPSVAALESRLGNDGRLRRLPPKFSFVIDAKGRLPLGDVDADIRFDAGAGIRFSVTLAGENALAAECAPRETGDVVARLGLAFLSLAGDGEATPRRMRALVEREGAEAIFAKAALRPRPCERSRQRPASSEILGTHAYNGKFVIGAASAFGEIEAARLKTFIECARVAGASDLRLTPWRALLITGLDPRGAEALVETIAKLNFIVDAGDPRLRIEACAGAPACMHAHRGVREDATRWAPMLPKGDGVIVHVSGCAKGCARPAATAMTLTATTNGYDLIPGGRAGDPPARRSVSSVEIAKFLANDAARMFENLGPT